MPKTKLYALTAGDRAIFERARREDNPSIITNFYLRNEDSGTWWRAVTDKEISELSMPESISAAKRWQEGYESLFAIWEYLKKPDFFAPVGDDWQKITGEQYETMSEELKRCYRVVFDVAGIEPTFHHPHGIQLIPWQLEASRSKHPIQVIVGGFGSAKTYYKILTMLARGITLPGYRAFALAPYSTQANEVHKQALQIIEGSRFERFLINAPTKPFPHIVLGNDYVGKTSIECYPIMDDTGKILTLTGDEALVDQAEQIPDIDELIRNVGSRFRGQFRGRPRVGQISLVANSGDNPMLWDWFDEALTDPDYVWSKSPGTFENTYLTVKDLIRFERQVGKDERARRVYLMGERPIGNGEHFPVESLERCRATWLDEKMTLGINSGVPGFKRMTASRVSIHNWEMPPEPDHRYLVAADPGWGNPPMRNSAAIAVWDITGFPKVPAIMVAFDWVFGQGSPNPWMSKYAEYVDTYKCIGFNGFDATGFQSGYERMTDMSLLLPTPVSLSGTKKFGYLNFTKKIMADGKFQIPSITHIFSQCSKYRIPDDNLRQDLVMLLLVTSALLEPMYYIDLTEPATEPQYNPDDRYWRGVEDRYEPSIFSARSSR